MKQKFFLNWSLWIGLWSGIYVYVYLSTPLAASGLVWMTFVALPIYFNGGAKREEFFNYLISMVVGVAWGLLYLVFIDWLIAIGIEPKLATASIVFVLTALVCGVHFLLPSMIRLNIIPIMFGGISMMFSQGGGNVFPVLCTLAGGLLLGLICNEGSKLLTEDGNWRFLKK